MTPMMTLSQLGLVRKVGTGVSLYFDCDIKKPQGDLRWRLEMA
jgi:hypothetical protein